MIDLQMYLPSINEGQHSQSSIDYMWPILFEIGIHLVKKRFKLR
jgi:hypothetical protein